jgi:penicillin-binding protein 2
LLPYSQEHFAIVHDGMDRVVNGPGGTARGSILPVEGVKMGGKTGTAQVRGLDKRGGNQWKYRDHGLFVCFAPVDNPRYAAAVVIEHGVGGARAAAPVAKDVLTFLYDREKAMAALESFESGWGGTPEERMARELATFRGTVASPAAPAATTPKPPTTVTPPANPAAPQKPPVKKPDNAA